MIINFVINLLNSIVFLDILVIFCFLLTIFNGIMFLLNRKKYKGLIIKLFLQTLAVNGLEIVLLLLANKFILLCYFAFINLGISLAFVGYGAVIKKEENLEKEKFFVNETHKKFINTLDNKIYNQNKTETNGLEEPFRLVATPQEPVKQKGNEPNYSHVKNVLERLGFYNLNSQEKRQVEDLKHNLILAENGTDKQEKINEGLGILLKIMAKYKV